MTTNTWNTSHDEMEKEKVSLKSVDNALTRFASSLPRLYTQLKQHVEIIRAAKRQKNIKSINKEQIAASKTFKTLKHYLKELDELENRVAREDVGKFKVVADPLREAAYQEILRFVELDNDLDAIKDSDLPSTTHSHPTTTNTGVPLSSSLSDTTCCHGNTRHDSSNQSGDVGARDDLNLHQSIEHQEPHQELMSLQQARSTEEDLKQLQENAKTWGQLQQDIQDVAEIMGNLSKVVKQQTEELDTIEQNVEVAQMQTRQGLLEIIKARRAKFAGIPVAGAVLGCVVGGPLGMLVGFKVAGVVTAAIGTYVGYRGGAFLRNKVNEDVALEGPPGGLEAPTLGAFEDEGDYVGEEQPEQDSTCCNHDDSTCCNHDYMLSEDSGEFQEFGDLELKLSERFK